jgi:D-tyrosyl-tRNA(Tyr) deacylase
MKALIQRVVRASVSVKDDIIGQIDRGLTIFLGVAMEDTEEDARYLANKIFKLRVFPDEDGKFNNSLLDIRGELLVVSQFTLLAETRKGCRPSFTGAAPPEEARRLFGYFVGLLRESGLKVGTGRFGEMMMVEICNDGPVTIMIDSLEKDLPRRRS